MARSGEVTGRGRKWKKIREFLTDFPIIFFPFFPLFFFFGWQIGGLWQKISHLPKKEISLSLKRKL